MLGSAALAYLVGMRGVLGGLVILVIGGGCAAERSDDVGAAQSAIANPDSIGFHPAVSRLTIGTPLAPPSGGLVSGRVVIGVHVADRWFVTAATSFLGVELVVSDVAVGEQPNPVMAPTDAIHFHPQAWPDAATTWDAARTEPANTSFDLALIELPSLPGGKTPARLYHPADEDAFLGLLGQVVDVAGIVGGTMPVPGAVGHQTITGAFGMGGLSHLVGSNTPGTLQFDTVLDQADIGAGIFRVLDVAALPPSSSFPSPCMPPAAVAGSEALVGIATDLGTLTNLQIPPPTIPESKFVPVFRPDLIAWIEQTIVEVEDPDADGVCGPADLCPEQVDAFQRSCNRLSETRNPVDEANPDESADVLPNACDPVPCPQADPIVLDSNECLQQLCPGGPPATTPACEGLFLPPDLDCSQVDAASVVCHQVRRDTLELRPLRSHPAPGEEGAVATTPPQPIATHGRFCQIDDALQISCDEDFDIQDDRLDEDGTVTVAAQELKEHHFHRITWTVDGFAVPLNGSVGVSYDVDHQALNGPARFVDWDHDPDLQRCLQDDLINDPCQTQLPTQDCFPLAGMIWFHADTLVGQTKTVGGNPMSIDLGTGLAPGVDRDLSNHHHFGPLPSIPYVPEEFSCFMCTFIDYGIPDPVPGGSSQGQQSGNAKGNKGGSGPGGGATSAAITDAAHVRHLVWRALPEPVQGGFVRSDAGPREDDVVLPARPGSAAMVAVRAKTEPNCDGELLEEGRAGAALSDLMNDASVVLANAVEPTTRVGPDPTFPLAIALDRVGGSAIVDVVVTDGAALLAGADRPSCPAVPRGCLFCPGGRCDQQGVCCSIPCTTRSTGRAPPCAGAASCS